MLKKVLASLLVALVFVIGSTIINAKPVSVNQLSYTVEQTSAPPGADLQLEQHQAEFELTITQGEQITHVSDVTVKGDILARGVPPRVMDQIIKIEDENSIRSKSKRTDLRDNKERLLLQRRYKHCELYQQLNMQYRS